MGGFCEANVMIRAGNHSIHPSRFVPDGQNSELCPCVYTQFVPNTFHAHRFLNKSYTRETMCVHCFLVRIHVCYQVALLQTFMLQKHAVKTNRKKQQNTNNSGQYYDTMFTFYSIIKLYRYNESQAESGRCKGNRREKQKHTRSHNCTLCQKDRHGSCQHLFQGTWRNSR